MFEVLALAASMGASAVAYAKSRAFTRTRLRFVDRAQRPNAPVIAGAVAAVVVAPLAVLPIIGLGTAAAVGVAVGLGVRAGQERSSARQLPPG